MPNRTIVGTPIAYKSPDYTSSFSLLEDTKFPLQKRLGLARGVFL
jgi:hypothetical protein